MTIKTSPWLNSLCSNINNTLSIHSWRRYAAKHFRDDFLMFSFSKKFAKVVSCVTPTNCFISTKSGMYLIDLSHLTTIVGLAKRMAIESSCLTLPYLAFDYIIPHSKTFTDKVIAPFFLDSRYTSDF
jgi:hypothetical protein